MKAKDNHKKRFYLSGLILIAFIPLIGRAALNQEIKPTSAWSVRMAESVIQRHPQPWLLESPSEPKWEYTYGLVMKSILDVWEKNR